MDRRVLLTGAGSLAAWTVLKPSTGARAADKTTIVFWHAMSGANGEEIERLARDFNASQSDVTLEAVYKGSYPETLTAAIAAFRAGKAPNIVQVFEVGTGTMLQAGPAIKPAWKLAEETGLALDPKAYIPGVRGYYSLPDGKLASMPFNSSTAVMWYNKDAFEKAGLDPESPPTTYADFETAARTLAAKAPTPIASTTAWMTWIQFEEYAAIQNSPSPPRTTATTASAPNSCSTPSPSWPSSSASWTSRRTGPSSTPGATGRRTRCSIRARPPSASARRRAGRTS